VNGCDQHCGVRENVHHDAGDDHGYDLHDCDYGHDHVCENDCVNDHVNDFPHCGHDHENAYAHVHDYVRYPIDLLAS